MKKRANKYRITESCYTRAEKKKKIREAFGDDDYDFESEWEEVDSKSVPDADGFYIDYTWYTDNNGRHIFMFGDKDVYTPDEGYADWETDDEKQAQIWFNNYEGFLDIDDEDYSDEIDEAELNEAYMIGITTDGKKQYYDGNKWLDTTEGAKKYNGTTDALSDFNKVTFKGNKKKTEQAGFKRVMIGTPKDEGLTESVLDKGLRAKVNGKDCNTIEAITNEIVNSIKQARFKKNDAFINITVD